MVIEESPNDLRHLFNHSSHLVQKYKKMSKKWLMTLAHPYTTVRRLWIVIFDCDHQRHGPGTTNCYFLQNAQSTDKTTAINQ